MAFDTSRPRLPTTADASICADIDAERAVLAAATMDPYCIDVASGIVSDADFYDRRHAAIFRALRALRAAGSELDPFAVYSQLGADAAIVGLPYILGLPNEIASVLLVEPRCVLLAKLATIRRHATTLRNLSITADAAASDPDTWLESMRAEASRLGADKPIGKSIAISPVQQKVEWQQWRDADLRCCPTGIDAIDRKLGGGLYATELCILGARTRVGKTAFGVQLLANARRAGWKCLLFSCEMRPLELQMRYASSLTSYHLDRIRAKDLDPYQWGEVDRAAQQWIDLDVPVVYGVLSVTKIERELALHPDVDFILCDYIQKYRPPEGQRYGQREQEVAAVAGALKDLAMRRNVIVLALAQLNREAEKGGESRLPLLTDIRESDAISQDANNILLLHRDLGGLDKMAATLILAKNRSGGEQVVKMRMSPSFTFLAETRAWEK